MPVDPIDLAALRALLAAGTPGPWAPCRAREGSCECGFVWSGDGECIVSRAADRDDTDRCLDGPQAAKNAALIAAAVNALGPLLDSLDAAERERAGRSRVAALLTATGCDCTCGHSWSEHDDGCIRCFPCRVAAELGEEE